MTVAIENKDWRLRQLAELEQSEPALVGCALDRLLEEDEALHWSVVIGAYRDAEISLSRAAAMLQLHPLELRQQLVVKGIPLHLGPENMADAQAEIDTIRSVLLDAAEQRIQATGGIAHDDLWRQVDEDAR